MQSVDGQEGTVAPYTAADADVGIVGAGFAGLAAALTLRRHRQSVLVFDGGPSRNAWAREVHGYLGVPDLSGQQFRAGACEQVRNVGGHIVPARIERARQEGGLFVLEDGQGGRWGVARLLLATGVTDRYPEIDNFFDFYGQSVHVCPHCDAYEWRDQPVAIVAWNDATYPFVLKLTQWTRQITVVTDGRDPEIDAGQRADLERRGIRILTGTVRRFEGTDGQLTALRFEDGRTQPVRAAFFNIGVDFQTDLAEQLGCHLQESGCITVDEHTRTSQEGVWAAGDVAGQEQLVAVATALGVKAGVDIYRSLPLPTGEATPGWEPSPNT